MYVLIGNADALEGYRDPTSGEPDAVHYRDLPGQQVTTINLPEGVGLQEAFSTVVTTLGFHLASGAKPKWVESDSAGLQSLLQEHFSITDAQNNRPTTWGKNTSAAMLTREA